MSKKYTLELSKKDFLTLFKMVLIADRVVCGIHDKPEKERPEYYNFYQKIMKIAYEFGFKNEVEFSEEMQMYFPTREIDDDGEAMDLFDEYSHESFWQDLIYKYFGTLFDQKHGGAQGKMMLELILKDEELFDAVEAEVLENGLRNFTNKNIAGQLKDDHEGS